MSVLHYASIIGKKHDTPMGRYLTADPVSYAPVDREDLPPEEVSRLEYRRIKAQQRRLKLAERKQNEN